MMTGRHDGQSATRYRTATVDRVGLFYREAGPSDAPVVLPGDEFHSLGTGHFALEDQAPEIARLMRGFLGRVLAAGLGS
jgi:hypothetical protein